MADYSVKRVSVDLDTLNFLKGIYFGDETNLYLACSERAYRDLNRTLRLKEFPDEVCKEMRKSIGAFLEEKIKKLSANPPRSQEAFDSWHKEICVAIREKYLAAGIPFTIGQAQKWLNMTFKYLYVIDADHFDSYFEFLHVPVDNYVFILTQKRFEMKKPSVCWSKWDDYDKQYLPFEKEIRAHLPGIAPLRWEFRSWLEEARNISIEDN